MDSCQTSMIYRDMPVISQTHLSTILEKLGEFQSKFNLTEDGVVWNKLNTVEVPL